MSAENECCIPFVDIRDLAAIIQELKLQKFDYTKWSELGLYLGLYYEPTLKAIDVYRSRIFYGLSNGLFVCLVKERRCC